MWIRKKISQRRNHGKKMSQFKKELAEFRASESSSGSRFKLSEQDLLPCMDDRTATTGFDRHYVYHVAWAVRKVKELNPRFHTDISSSLHFCSTLSAVLPVKFYDYRPAKLELDNLTSEAADLHKLPFANESIESISCLHTIEHVGLGRYGDPIDYNGDIKAINELKRVVAKGGSFFLVVPVGEPRIVFNAHRIYGFSQVMEYMTGFELKECALVPDKEEDGGLIINADKTLFDKQRYGCGCFWFIKK